MLVGSRGVIDRARFFRRGIWLSLIVLLLSLLSLTPYFVSSTEVVRMRHALVLVDAGDDAFDWTPADVPADFLLERGAVDPLFRDVVKQLDLASLPSDWERAVAIGRHLLGSRPILLGGAIQSDLRDTYRRIVGNGEGYCGDFVRVFSGLAIAAGIPVRAWAFSFDGFGGHGHILPEIWNRQLGRWQLIDVFNNYYFVDAEGVPLSALDLRRAMREKPATLHLVPVHSGARAGEGGGEKAWDYYRRGLGEWYLVWGNNVFSYDQALLVRSFGPLSRSLEQLGGIVQGVYPGVAIVAEPGNDRQLTAMHHLRTHLLIVGGLLAVALPALFVSIIGWLLARRDSPLRQG